MSQTRLGRTQFWCTTTQRSFIGTKKSKNSDDKRTNREFCSSKNKL